MGDYWMAETVKEGVRFKEIWY